MNVNAALRKEIEICECGADCELSRRGDCEGEYIDCDEVQIRRFFREDDWAWIHFCQKHEKEVRDKK